MIAEETGTTIENFGNYGSYSGEVNTDTPPKPHGVGVHRRSNGLVIYEGEWLNGVRHGVGVHRYSDPANPIEYEGQWQNDNYHGLGVQRNQDGSLSWAGLWDNGAATGITGCRSCEKDALEREAHRIEQEANDDTAIAPADTRAWRMFEAAGLMEKAAVIAEETGTTIEDYR
eukprot:GHVU01048423.1.p1 GENE.GHVU01048423.1~~GHVU01048423.1.p1  ORF type:complete len:197 (+),score=27.67 GHVU01048423.1:78-593(+)